MQPKSSQSCFQHSTRTPRVTGTSRFFPHALTLAGLFDPLAVLGHAAAVQQCNNAAVHGVGGSICMYHGKRFPESSEFSVSTPGNAKPLCPTSVLLGGPFTGQCCWVSSTDLFREVCQQHRRNHSAGLPFYLVMFPVSGDCQCLGRTYTDSSWSNIPYKHKIVTG